MGSPRDSSIFFLIISFSSMYNSSIGSRFALQARIRFNLSAFGLDNVLSCAFTCLYSGSSFNRTKNPFIVFDWFLTLYSILYGKIAVLSDPVKIDSFIHESNCFLALVYRLFCLVSSGSCLPSISLTKLYGFFS